MVWTRPWKTIWCNAPHRRLDRLADFYPRNVPFLSPPLKLYELCRALLS
jgi:hypothetical protein